MSTNLCITPISRSLCVEVVLITEHGRFPPGMKVFYHEKEASIVFTLAALSNTPPSTTTTPWLFAVTDLLLHQSFVLENHQLSSTKRDKTQIQGEGHDVWNHPEQTGATMSKTWTEKKSLDLPRKASPRVCFDLAVDQ